MVGRALIGSLASVLVAGTAWAEEPVAAAEEGRAVEIVDPYAEPEPRIVDVIDPYATPAAASSELDLERVCRNYCLARRDALPAPTPRLPPLQQTEEWGSEPAAQRSTGIDQQTVGALVLGLSALAGSAFVIAEANSNPNGSTTIGETLAATGIGVGLMIGLVLVVDGHDGKTEVRVASR
jgi:hypothetical protein